MLEKEVMIMLGNANSLATVDGSRVHEVGEKKPPVILYFI